MVESKLNTTLTGADKSFQKAVDKLVPAEPKAEPTAEPTGHDSVIEEALISPIVDNSKLSIARAPASGLATKGPPENEADTIGDLSVISEGGLGPEHAHEAQAHEVPIQDVQRPRAGGRSDRQEGREPIQAQVPARPVGVPPAAEVRVDAAELRERLWQLDLEAGGGVQEDAWDRVRSLQEAQGERVGRVQA